MRISDWSSDVCSSDLVALIEAIEALLQPAAHSSKGTRPPAGRGRRSRQRALIAGQPGCLNLVRHLALVLPLLFDALVGHVPDAWGKDRRSTRLNSGH